MENFLKSLQLFLFFGFFVLSPSCQKEEAPCSAVNCNAGTFDAATCACDCPEGYSGTNCESLSADVQFWLDSGEYTPLELVEEGVPVDSIYKKSFMGGIIFYLDINDELPEIAGMVAHPEDYPEEVQWGCLEVDIPGLPIVSNIGNDNSVDTLPGSRIGEGKANTDLILEAMCQSDTGNEKIAARVCRNLGEDWFLPSRGELRQLVVNLDTQNDPSFIWGGYWSSTRGPNNLSYTISSHSYHSLFQERNMYKRVRAVKVF